MGRRWVFLFWAIVGFLEGLVLFGGDSDNVGVKGIDFQTQQRSQRSST